MMYLRGPVGAPAIEYHLSAFATPNSKLKGLGDTSSDISSGLTILAVLAFGWLALKVVEHGQKHKRRRA